MSENPTDNTIDNTEADEQQISEPVAPAAEVQPTEESAPVATAEVAESDDAIEPVSEESGSDDVPAEDKAEEVAEEADQGPRFADFGLDSRVLKALNAVGYEKPSPIQAATIPVLMEGRDVVGLAQTGTGKTAAFAIPALSLMAERAAEEGPSKDTQVLVLAPTRELALQVAEAFTSYARYLDDFTVLPVYGGSAYGPQLAGLRRGAQVVVGTPGRVIDHIAKGSLDLSTVRYLVLDEADEMLRMGFAEDVEQILAETPEDKQVALFSATMPGQIRRIAKKYLDEPAEISVKAKTTTGENTRQRYLQVMGPHKLDAMTRILEVEDYDGVIAFVRTKMATEELADKLKSRGHRAAAINGDIPQQQRERTVEALRNGEIDVLVATDVAARGLDVERISLVVNYDIPHDTESYVHRIGRTGRAGRSGDAILFMTPREKYLLRAIEKATRQPVEQMHLPTAETINNLRLGKFAERITETLESEDLSTFRELVAGYEAEHDVTAVEIAAALALMAQGGEPLLVKDLPSTPEFQKRDRNKDGFGSRGPTRSVTEGNATYRIAVGRRHRVMPGSIVGALANEGGFSSSQIGGIDIRSDHTLVELPAELSKDQWRALSRTRIGGEPIHLELDTGRKPNSDRGDRPERADRGDRGGWQGNRGNDRPDRGGDRGGRFGGGGFSGGPRNDRNERGGYQGNRDDRPREGGYQRRENHDRGYERRDSSDRRDSGFERRGSSDRFSGGPRNDRGGRSENRGGSFENRGSGSEDRGANRGERKPRWGSQGNR
ncbi:DEAD/DEAH box helicase [Psychromicrobium xiongbiense]|uniref:DEAD/DEAH box helicase n=1 Tax=Psychromicrobium xiongbiense TaxID=3051184 RepID=UPI0025557D27|nr:DEAD/DEAH box helicase [Psychromicrobium sp. YIM S02556]